MGFLRVCGDGVWVSVASSWPFILQVLTTMHGQTHIKLILLVQGHQVVLMVNTQTENTASFW